MVLEACDALAGKQQAHGQQHQRCAQIHALVVASQDPPYLVVLTVLALAAIAPGCMV
jgi:hypothetical protein